jgi:2'-5' RNA ligase
MQGVSRTALRPFLRKHAETEFALWKVAGFALFSSVLSREGATHSVELRQEFA